MWVWLDNTGKVKQYLMHGPSPVVGETDFQIFVYFDGLDTTVFNTAEIKFKKPDRQGNSYPVFFRARTTCQFIKEPNDSQLTNFVDGQYYTGFLFDFSEFAPGEEVVKLLDTPGLWQVTITCLAPPSKTKVSGLITFTVGPSASDSENETEISIDQALENLVLSTMLLRRDSNSYLRVAENFVSDAENGRLDSGMYSVGSTVFDLTTENFYKILTVTPGDENESSATYEKVYRSVKACDVDADMSLDEAYRQNDGDLAVFKKADGGLIFSTFRYENDGDDVRFDAMEFATGNRYGGVFGKDTPFLGLLIDANLTQTPIDELANDVSGMKRLATEYDGSVSYAPGDIVTHDGGFYRCVAATSGPWIVSAWEDLSFEWMIGNSDKSYTYRNDQGQDTWVIDHNLGKRPSVTIVADSDNREVIADIEYVSDNRIIIHFQAALNGSAYLN